MNGAFSDEDEQQEYELAILEGHSEKVARQMAAEARAIFNMDGVV